MLTPKQVRIFEAFLRRPYEELTYKAIKEYSKGNSNSTVQCAIRAFIQEGLVSKRVVGNVILYAARLDNTNVL